MKKLFILFITAILFTVNGAFARDVDRKIIKDATIEQIQAIILDTISLYEGVITKKEINKNEHKYVVDYNGTTFWVW